MLAKETAVTASRVLDELKERLSAAYGERLHAVVLFVSEARNVRRSGMASHFRCRAA